MAKRGIRPVAISVDPPATTRERLAPLSEAYTFLSDAGAKVLRRYDLADHVNGEEVARPAEILLDPTGTVRWVNLTHDYRVRARPETVVEVFDRLNAGR